MSTLKKIIGSEHGPRAGQVGHFVAAAVALAYLQALPAVLAKNTTQSGQAANQTASQEVAAGSSSVEGNVSASEEASRKSEESLLSKALEQLKASNLTAAMTNLSRLKDEFPDNDDYLLLYRTALRIKNSSDADSQKWYTYVRSLDKKEEEKHAFLSAANDSSSVPAQGHINELKRETWLILTTGKHKSANQGRRTQQQAK